MLKPIYPVKSNQVLEFNRNNPFEWTYSQDNGSPLPFGTSGFLTFSNAFGQTLATFETDATGGVLPFFEEVSVASDIPNGTSWALTIDYNDGNSPRLREQGTVIRAEAPFPNAPATSDIFTGVQYSYPFGTPGLIVDPAWLILAGNPQVYDNSGDSHPNGVGAGVDASGNYSDIYMQYYAPLKTDTVRFTYTIVPSGQGDAYVVLCSNYQATNFAAIHHKHVTAGDKISIATGTGPTSISDATSLVTHTLAYENFTAEYNPSSNTFSVYVGASTDPLVSWTDSSNTVHHGAGDRYVGLGFHSTSTAPGPEVSGWFASDQIGT